MKKYYFLFFLLSLFFWIYFLNKEKIYLENKKIIDNLDISKDLHYFFVCDYCSNPENFSQFIKNKNPKIKKLLENIWEKEVKYFKEKFNQKWELEKIMIQVMENEA